MEWNRALRLLSVSTPFDTRDEGCAGGTRSYRMEKGKMPSLLPAEFTAENNEKLMKRRNYEKQDHLLASCAHHGA